MNSKLLERAIIKLGKEFDDLDLTFHKMEGAKPDDVTSYWPGPPEDDILVCVFKGTYIHEPFHRQDFFFINYAYERDYQTLCARPDNLITIHENECIISQPYSGYGLRRNSNEEAVIIGILIKIFLANPIEVGCSAFFRDNTEAPPAPLSTIKTGFQNYGHTFVTLFLRDLFLLLWSLLLLIPGIIKAYSYCMVPYILADHPELTATETIARSKEMMNGNKWQAFLLDLSFIGWILLGILTLGLVLVFWTAPYMQSSNAALYLKLSGEEA